MTIIDHVHIPVCRVLLFRQFDFFSRGYLLPCACVGSMNALISFILHPLIPVNVGSDDDDQTGIDVVYPLSIFFAFGIWLVFQRYQKMHNSAVPFDYTAPLVRLL